MTIRVVRIMEYEYETARDMEKDMACWTHSSPAHDSSRRGWRSRFRSCHLPMQVINQLQEEAGK